MIDTLTEVEQFYLTYRPLVDHELIRKAIEKHIEYGTITVLQDKKGISGLVRFDVVGERAFVHDLIIRTDLERHGIIKLLVARSWKNFPYLRFFSFFRDRKYPGRKQRVYRLARMFK